MPSLNHLLAPPRRSRRPPRSIEHRPGWSRAQAFAIRIGCAGGESFATSLGTLDAAVREALEATDRSMRPVASVLLPEALHLVVIGGVGPVTALAQRLEAVFASREAETRSLEERPSARLRLSVIQVGGAVQAAGTVLDFPRSRGLIGSGGVWPYSQAH